MKPLIEYLPKGSLLRMILGSFTFGFLFVFGGAFLGFFVINYYVLHVPWGQRDGWLIVGMMAVVYIVLYFRQDRWI